MEKVGYEYTYNLDGSRNRYAKYDKVKHYIQVPCGKCLGCLANSQSQWSFRIEQEVLHGGHVASYFITYTFDNDHLPEDYSVNKEHMQDYFHNLRENLKNRYGYYIGFKYYCCAEYGSKRGRPHYHVILMLDKSVDWRIIQSSWGKGIVDIRPFTSARAGYVAKYSVKQEGLDFAGRTPPFRMVSNGLGLCFLDGKTAESMEYVRYWRNLSGRLVKIPKYYYDKLYSRRVRLVTYNEDGTKLRVPDLFGNPTVVERSITFPTPARLVMQRKAEREFLHRERLEMAKFGNTGPSYYLWKDRQSVKLEYELNKRNQLKIKLHNEEL